MNFLCFLACMKMQVSIAVVGQRFRSFRFTIFGSFHREPAQNEFSLYKNKMLITERNFSKIGFIS